MEFLRSIFAPNITSEKFRLNVQDFIKGLYMALAPALTMVVDAIMAWSASASAVFNLDFKMLIKISVGCMVMYLVKNFFTSPPK